MITLKNFKEHNDYVGLPEPMNEHIDMGRYDDSDILQASDPVRINFYRISYKRNYAEGNVDAVLLYSPEQPLEWDLEERLEGYYLQLSKELINKHRYLFQNHMEYGQHEPLLLTENEEMEVQDIFESLLRHYREQPDNTAVLVSYAHVLMTLIENFYQRQFSTDIRKYNRIVTEFQQMLHDYYNQEIEQLPNVQYFADKLQLTPNYLGDIVKHHTGKTAIDTIHDFIIEKAKILLKTDSSNMSQIAFSLGFEYPNNFSKFFKTHTGLTPSSFRNQHQKMDSKV